MILWSLLRPCSAQTQGTTSFATRLGAVETAFTGACGVGGPLGKTQIVMTPGVSVMTFGGWAGRGRALRKNTDCYEEALTVMTFRTD